MKGGSKSLGFTMVEVLIVLAVSGALFIMAATLISGKQRRTEFTTAANDVRSQIEQVVREVETGYYANQKNFNCTASPSGPALAAGSTGQGANKDCVFMGKVIQFRLNSTSPEQMKIYPLAGLRQNASGNEVTTLSEAKPTVIAPSLTSPSLPDNSQSMVIKNGLTTSSVVWGTGNTSIGSVAIVPTLATYSGGNIVSGSQQLSLIPINNSFINDSTKNAVEIINTNLISSTAGGGNGIRVCFVSNGTNQSAKVTIGGFERQLSVKLEIKENKTCA